MIFKHAKIQLQKSLNENEKKKQETEFMVRVFHRQIVLLLFYELH